MATLPNWRKSVSEITDRAKRYRANRVKKLGKFCENCGSRKNLLIGHRDGNESHNADYNLGTFCKSCNGIQAHEDKRAGRGVRTRQYNSVTWGGMKPKTKRCEKCGGTFNAAIVKGGLCEACRAAQKNPGAINLAQYVQAAMDHVRGSHDVAGATLHETPKAVRREFAKEIWWRRGYRGNPPEDIMPEYWAGKLRDSHGRIVRDEKQAKAILLSELRALGKIGPRRNPSDADELYRKFHGRGPDKIYEMQRVGLDPYGDHPELSSLGPLVRLIVGEGVKLGGEYGDEVQEADWVREISFVPSITRWHDWLERSNPPITEVKARLKEWETPDLAQVPADPDRKESRGQLYIVGGNQDLDAQLPELGSDPEKDLADLGSVFLVEYFTQKRFDRFQPINYFHHFSEKTGGDWPRLIYNRPAKLLSFAGGSYSVTSRGIEN
jgi:ribosomal protein S27AE